MGCRSFLGTHREYLNPAAHPGQVPVFKVLYPQRPRIRSPKRRPGRPERPRKQMGVPPALQPVELCRTIGTTFHSRNGIKQTGDEQPRAEGLLFQFAREKDLIRALQLGQCKFIWHQKSRKGRVLNFCAKASNCGF
jgi:hypothetical protein